MYRYTAFGLTIVSELQIDELNPAESGEADIVIRLGTVPDHGVPKGSLQEQFVNARAAGRFHVRFGNEIIVDLAAESNPRLVKVLLLGRVMACLLRLRGYLPLHGSAVEINGRAAIFLGPSGAGKSTLAAACHARGHSIITDDVAAVARQGAEFRILVAGTRIRLMEESLPVLKGVPFRSRFHLDKYDVDVVGTGLSGAIPVRRVYLIQFGEVIELRLQSRLTAASVFSIQSFIRHPWLTKEALQQHLHACAEMAAAVPVYSLTRPRSLEGMDAVIELIEADMSAKG